MQTTINNTKLKKCNTIITNTPYVTKKIFVNGVQVFGGFVYDNGYADSDLTYSVAHQGKAAAEYKNYEIYLMSVGTGPGASGNDNTDLAAWALIGDIDFDGYDTLSIKFDMTSVYNTARVILGVVDSEPGLGAGFPQIFDAYLARNDFIMSEATDGVDGSVTDHTLTCDVKNVTGKHKILIMVWSGQYWESSKAEVHVRQIEFS